MWGWVQLCCWCVRVCVCVPLCLQVCIYVSVCPCLHPFILAPPYPHWQLACLYFSHSHWALAETLLHKHRTASHHRYLSHATTYTTKGHECCSNKHTGTCGCWGGFKDRKLLSFAAALWIGQTWGVSLAGTHLASTIVFYSCRCCGVKCTLLCWSFTTLDRNQLSIKRFASNVIFSWIFGYTSLSFFLQQQQFNVLCPSRLFPKELKGSTFMHPQRSSLM